MSSRRSKGGGPAKLENEPFDLGEFLETLNRRPKLVVLDLGACSGSSVVHNWTVFQFGSACATSFRLHVLANPR